MEDSHQENNKRKCKEKKELWILDYEGYQWVVTPFGGSFK